MPGPPERPPAPTRRPRAPAFEPRFTLTLVYLAFFFVLFAFLLALPSLLDVLGNTPPGPEQQEAAKQAMQRALAGRFVPVFVMSLAAAGIGAYYRVLPGLRARR